LPLQVAEVTAQSCENAVAVFTVVEAQAFRIGAAEKLREMVGAQTGQNRLMNMWKDRPVREKLKALLGDDVKYSEVESLLKNEMTLKRLEGLGPSRNSRTFSREANAEDQNYQVLSDMTDIGVGMKTGNMLGPVTRILKDGYQRLGTPEQVRDGIGKSRMQKYAPAEIKALMEAQEAIRRQRGLASTSFGTAAGQVTNGLLD
jgi:hypothetical protein